ncbi:MAG: hypothetical protein JXQ29_13835 [Planctomycetes bacterium]|nr:hypothetical protein [Planctomycetota bacterium]
MIAEKFVDLYARDSGLRDKLERDVIADAKSGWNEPLASRLRDEIRSLLPAE